MPLKSDLMLGKRAVTQELVSQASLQVILEEQRHLEGQGEYRPLGELLVSMLSVESDALARLYADLEREACAQLATHVGRQLVAEKLTNDVALRSAMRGFKRDTAARPSGLLTYLATIGGLVENASGAVTAAQVDAVTDAYLAIVGYGTLIVARDDEEQRLRIGYQRGMVDEGKVFYCVWCRMRGVGTAATRLAETLGEANLEQVDAIRRRLAAAGGSGEDAAPSTGGSAPAPATRPNPVATKASSSKATERPTSAAKPPSKPVATVTPKTAPPGGTADRPAMPLRPPSKPAAAVAKPAPAAKPRPPIAEPLGSIDDSSESLEVPDFDVPSVEASSAEWITFDPPVDGSIATVILPVNVASVAAPAPGKDPPSAPAVGGTAKAVGPSGRDVFSGEHEKDTFREAPGRPAAPSERAAEPRPAPPRVAEPRTPPRPSATRDDRPPSPRPDDRRPSPVPPPAQSRSPRRETTRKNRVRRKDSGRSMDPMWLAGGGLFLAALVLLAVVIAMRDTPHAPSPPVRPGGGSSAGSGSDGGGAGGGTGSGATDPSPELVARHAQARQQIEQQLAAGMFDAARGIAAQFAKAIEEAGVSGEAWDDRRTELELMISSREMDRYNQVVTQFDTAISEQRLDAAEKILAELHKVAPATERDQLKFFEERLREARRGGSGSGER